MQDGRESDGRPKLKISSRPASERVLRMIALRGELSRYNLSRISAIGSCCLVLPVHITRYHVLRSSA